MASGRASDLHKGAARLNLVWHSQTRARGSGDNNRQACAIGMQLSIELCNKFHVHYVGYTCNTVDMEVFYCWDTTRQK